MKLAMHICVLVSTVGYFHCEERLPFHHGPSETCLTGARVKAGRGSVLGANDAVSALGCQKLSKN